MVGKHVEWKLIGRIKDKDCYETIVPVCALPDVPKRKIQMNECGYFC